MLTVKQYQRNLKVCGFYYTGLVDGEKGPATTKAIKAFQKDFGLTVDGDYGPLTNDALMTFVKSIQKAVGVTQDGKVGNKTIAAIKAFQKKHGLTVDGIAGPTTIAKMELGWDKSAHFTKEEFKCKCGGKYCNGYPAHIDPALIDVLEKLRSYYGKPITITSGLRCVKQNTKVGGVNNSQHKFGKAADFYIPGICDTAASRSNVVKNAREFGAKYAYCNTTGMGNAVHINV